jgi:hypothetical protein
VEYWETQKRERRKESSPGQREECGEEGELAKKLRGKTALESEATARA